MSIALVNLVDPKQIALNLRANTQEAAMREIVNLLVAADKIDIPPTRDKRREPWQ